jgi:hypothetical protein
MAIDTGVPDDALPLDVSRAIDRAKRHGWDVVCVEEGADDSITAVVMGHRSTAWCVAVFSVDGAAALERT